MNCKKAFLLIIGFLCLGLFLKAQDTTIKKNNETAINYGIASWYSDSFNGKRTANGEIFSQQKFTCASNKYKLGTWLKVTLIKNKKWVIVKVNDRLHPRMKRIVDLTRAAAAKIGIIKSGLGKVSVQIVKKP